MEVERERRRVELADGACTTVHVVTYERAAVAARVVRLEPEGPFERWCQEREIAEALSGGFAKKPEYDVLGELWIDGRIRDHRPFRGAWARRRGALAVDGDLRIDGRDRLDPLRDLVQAGPVLVREGRSAIAGVEDPEGFSSTAEEEFDQDLTASREPRLAIGLSAERVICVAADGRADDDAGLTFWELADVLVDLGAVDGLNLDGGSASALVSNGARRNMPRDDDGNDLSVSSPSVTGIVFGDA